MVRALGQQLIERLPQIDIFDRLARGGLPAFGFPALHPFGDAFAHVFAIHVDADAARALECLKRLDHGSQLHTVVGGEGFAATELFGGSNTPQPPGPGLPLQAPSV
jgi:hypothetical protein